LYRFRDKTRYWSKITIFHTPSASDVPFRGTTSSYWHSIVAVALCCIVSEIKRDWLKIEIFSYPVCIWHQH